MWSWFRVRQKTSHLDSQGVEGPEISSADFWLVAMTPRMLSLVLATLAGGGGGTAYWMWPEEVRPVTLPSVVDGGGTVAPSVIPTAIRVEIPELKEVAGEVKNLTVVVEKSTTQKPPTPTVVVVPAPAATANATAIAPMVSSDRQLSDAERRNEALKERLRERHRLSR